MLVAFWLPLTCIIPCFVAERQFVASGNPGIPGAIACFCSFLYGVFLMWFGHSRGHERQFAFKSRFVGRRRVPAISRRLCVNSHMISLRQHANIHVHYQTQHGTWKLITFRSVQVAKKFIDERHHSHLSTLPFKCWVSSPRCNHQGTVRLLPSECLLCQEETSFRHRVLNKPSLVCRFFAGFLKIKTFCHDVLSRAFRATHCACRLPCLWTMILCICIQTASYSDLKQSDLRKTKNNRCGLCLWSPKKLARWFGKVHIPSVISYFLFENSFLRQNSFHDEDPSDFNPFFDIIQGPFCNIVSLVDHMQLFLYWSKHGRAFFSHKFRKIPANSGTNFPYHCQGNMHPKLCIWLFTIFTLALRIGEAQNPGPVVENLDDCTLSSNKSDFLWVGACNPTQLLGKEEVCESWGQGIWTYAETSTTPKAAYAIQSRFKKFGSSILFGEHVKPQTSSTLFRGRAGGVAISSGFPVRRHIHPQPEWLVKSTRFVDAVVHVQGHLPIYVSSIYGFAGKCSSHPMELTEDILNQAANRAVKYKGPALICGDFNADISSMQAWKNLEMQGWYDLALLDSRIYDRQTQPTSKFGNRHSYILANGEMCRSFVSCRISEEYEFDSHPLLVGCFRISSLTTPAKQWILPKSLDQFLFDNDSIVANAQQVCHDRKHLFDAMLKSGDMSGAARQLSIAIEDTFKKSAVDVEGNKVHVPPGFLGRGRKSPLQVKRNFVPCVKPSRHGDFSPLMSQTTKGLRSYIKQLRRLQALHQQLSSFNSTHNIEAKKACEVLWNTVVKAHGFRGGFPKWISDHVDPLVPLSLPSLDFVSRIFECFQKYVKNERHNFFLNQSAVKKLNLLEDIEKGGRECFRAVRDEPTPPLATITWNNTIPIPKIRWAKSGHKNLPYHKEHKVDPNFPIVFQGQSRNIIRVSPGLVELDEPVTLKNSHENFFTQKITSADVFDVHSGLICEWGKLWNRDSANDSSQGWTEAAEFVSSLQDCPTCPFQELNESVWVDSLKGVKKLTARGADGFSTRDCTLIQGELLSWLIQILQRIESGNQWPQQWILARVVVLSKGYEPKTPLDIRPISILSKFYRLWSRLRSLEVLRHIGSLMPPQVSATSGGVSADLLAAYTADQIESAHFHQNPMCGIVIDLVKCYNLVPWLPSQWILSKLGIPSSYITAMFRFLEGIQRTFDFHGNCSDPIAASNGIAEGCAMSVALMAALSWFCHKIMEATHPEDIAVCYADNWGINSFSPDNLSGATFTLERICSALKMIISIPKSWFWTTNKLWKAKLKNILVQGQCLCIKDSAVDLGCDQNYGKKLRLQSQKKRVAKAKRVMNRIMKKKIPRHFRTTMVQSSGFGAFAYGQSLQYVPPTTWKSLRSATVGAI